MIEIKAGPELDRAVAEAIGDQYPRSHSWVHTGLSGHETSFFFCEKCGDFASDDDVPITDLKEDSCVTPYSTDLNAAFAAAEKTGLFNDWNLSQSQHDGSWTLHDNSDCCNEWIGFEQPTPALAICAAILKLGETGG